MMKGGPRLTWSRGSRSRGTGVEGPQVPALPRPSQHLRDKGTEKVPQKIRTVQRPFSKGRAGVNLGDASGSTGRVLRPRGQQQGLGVAGSTAGFMVLVLQRPNWRGLSGELVWKDSWWCG